VRSRPRSHAGRAQGKLLRPQGNARGGQSGLRRRNQAGCVLRAANRVLGEHAQMRGGRRWLAASAMTSEYRQRPAQGRPHVLRGQDGAVEARPASSQYPKETTGTPKMTRWKVITSSATTVPPTTLTMSARRVGVNDTAFLRRNAEIRSTIA